jgi:hypothetical protein
LFCRSGKAAQFFLEELAHRAIPAAILIPGDQCGNITFKPLLIVPMGGGLIAGPPFLPSEIGWCAIDVLDAIPFNPDTQVRVDPSEVVGDL